MRGLDIDSPSFADKKRLFLGAIVSIATLILVSPYLLTGFYYLRIATSSIDTSVCPVFEIKRPESFYLDNSTVLDIVNDKKFKLQSVQKLAGAIQVDTTVFDNQPDVSKNPEVWSKFAKFHTYLKVTFPTIFTLLEVEYVNTYGIVIYWKGSDKLLKPVMLTAHQDVVPVQKDTLKDWTYPPFEGHFDGEYIFGRGATDCKNVLIAIMEAIELLISQKFEPKRGIIAAFGFDEEALGIHGASSLAKHLENKFGKDSIYAIIDEGPGLIKDPYTNTIIGMPGTGEKGYIDISVELTTPGGHSSVPPDHTLIGIVSELAYHIENDQYESILTTANPILGYMQCLAVHDTTNKLSKFAKKSILRAGFDKFANSKVVELLRGSLLTKYLITTSQAIDIIKGGEKVNALPEYTKMVVNHRIAIESSIHSVQQHFIDRVVPIAKRHGLGVVGFNDEEIVETGDKGHFNIKVFSSPLSPAPVTPTDDTVWEYLAAATRHVFEDLVYTGDKALGYPIVLSPGIMTGNTDTRYYWNLSKNIFRYSPQFFLDLLHDSNAHSVDEKLKFENHLHLMAFFYEYIQLVDTKKADN